MGNLKSETGMTNQVQNPKSAAKACFVIRISDLIGPGKIPPGPRHSGFGFRVLFLLPLFICQSRAGATWNLTDAEFRSRAISIDSIDAAGIHSGPDILGWNDVLEISQAVNPPPAAGGRLSLIFRGGEKLGGTPISFNGDTLQWNSGRLGAVGFPGRIRWRESCRADTPAPISTSRERTT